MVETQRIIEYLKQNGANLLEFYEHEIRKWIASPVRRDMLTGDRYYLGDHDILKRKRTVIGVGGEISEVENLPNNKIVDNQYSKMVDQKTNYLVGKAPTIETDDDTFTEILTTKVFNRRFLRTFKNVCVDSLNAGIGWLHPYCDENGELKFKHLYPWEIIPFWKDAAHTELDEALRVYPLTMYDGSKEKTIYKVEAYTVDGIDYYTLDDNGNMKQDGHNPYLYVDEKAYNWERVPLVPFKYNAKELPLIKRVKSLQDGINTILSDFENNMQEDARNTILVLENYDGQNLGEFRKNLAQYGAIKVRSVDGAKGGVSTLTVEVNSENYKAIHELFKKALIENARGFDAKDDRLLGDANQMNIQSMYSDIDLDTNGIETEYQASFEDLLWFVKKYLANIGAGNFENKEVNIIFNRDMLMNESEIITNCKNSVGIISNETIISQHPWIKDVQEEQDRLDEEKQKALDEYNSAFPMNQQNNGGFGDA